MNLAFYNKKIPLLALIALFTMATSGCAWYNQDSSTTQSQAPETGSESESSGGEEEEVPESGGATSRNAVTAGDTSALLSWDSIENATAYVVYYSTSPTLDRNTATKLNDTVGSITGTSAAVDGLGNDTEYYFWIEAADGPNANMEVALGSTTPNSSVFSVLVANVTPKINALEVNPNTQLLIPFNSAIAPSSISPSPITVTVDSQVVAVSLALVNSGQTIEVIPTSGSWAQGATHTVSLSTDIQSQGGTALSSDFDFSFSTLDPGDLVAWWDFDNSLSDDSGNNNDIDTNSGVTFSNLAGFTKSGSHSAYFNGSSHLRLTDASFDLGDKFAVATWINIPSLGSSINTILSNASAGEPTSGFKIGVNNWNTSDKSVIMEAGSGVAGGKVVTPANFVQDGQWYHFAYNVDTTNLLPNGKYVQIFFNGVEADVSYTSAAIENMDWTAMKTTGPLYFGAFSPGSSYRLNGGYLDDLRIYSRPLTAAEVTNIAR